MSTVTPEKQPELTAPQAREAFTNFGQIALGEIESQEPVIAEGWYKPEVLTSTINNVAESAEVQQVQLAAAIEAKDDVKNREIQGEQEDQLRGRKGHYPHTDVHEQRVALLASVAAGELDAPKDLALISGLVHDWGKNDIDWKIVSFDGRYGDQEKEKMKAHADKSVDRINNESRLPLGISRIVKFHHTPTPEAGELSPEELRVHHALMCADIFDASTFRNDGYGSSIPAEKRDYVLSAFREILEGDQTQVENIFSKLADALSTNPDNINKEATKEQNPDHHNTFSGLMESLL